MKLDVKQDVRAVVRDLNKVQDDIVPKATATALNRTNRGVRTDVVRALAATMPNATQKRVRRRVLIPKGQPEFIATKRRLRAGGLILFRWFPEIYTIPKGKKAAKNAEGTNKFVQEMPGKGHRGLFRRSGSKRYPIKEFMVDLSFRASAETDRVLETKGAARFKKALEGQLKRHLKR